MKQRRLTGESAGRCVLIGDSHLHGIMDEEILAEHKGKRRRGQLSNRLENRMI
jgi:hypothetical protein